MTMKYQQQETGQSPANDDVSADRHYARFAYESLLLRQPHVHLDGLWESSGRFVIVCPGLNSQLISKEGRPISDWFNRECRPITCPIELATKAPVNAKRISERTNEELVLMHGEPLTLRDVLHELEMWLPPDFPQYASRQHNLTLYMSFNRDLTEEEEVVLDIACENQKLPITVEVEKSEVIRTDANNHNTLKNKLDDHYLKTARTVSNVLPKSVVDALIDDEEHWLDNRMKVFSPECDLNAKRLSNFEGTSACFVNAMTVPHKNIRIYLPLYERIHVAIPTADVFDEVLRSLAVTENEIIALAERGRVQFILPLSIDQYPSHFVAKAAEVNPSCLMMSRRLAVLTLLETRKRFPFLYPPFGARERRALLDLMEFDLPSDAVRKVIALLKGELGEAWVGMERNINVLGAMALSSHGLGRIFAAVYRQISGLDLRAEMISTSMSVEWSMALGSVYCSQEYARYSDSAMAEFCASLYSGGVSAKQDVIAQELDLIVRGLLAVDNDAPIEDIEQAFRGRDVARLNYIVSKIRKGESIESELAEMNGRIKAFERNQERIVRLDMLGLAAAIASAATGSGWPSVGSWVAQYLLKNADAQQDLGGPILDWVRAVNSLTSPDVVLISRVRASK